ncbi:maleylpyruvate isomerase family mycothiol-dependent enzyme [Pontivivens insulae]|uniref:Mycothiol-dependent maleylpyruvate isomerase metal-binding domain-containing protein n=1 Tax=Pontivivens insulae TaxID=1639689 RepID=A0A2R8ABT7_9RHOB|nr:maleylpyruvate isomerase family mycothiol-dependent enzyme [Pontivivens insulae]RED11282.1 uncharacterized protein (TIGR03084 family) [Pontivivens insulae]SPF29545.1 hypothetical protein POI8812_01857 [Pontivivens insulae]
MQQAIDFLEESRALHRLIAARPVAFLDEVTQFKGWRVAEIIRHLHVWNGMADLSRRDEDAFAEQMTRLGPGIMSGQTRVTECEADPRTGRTLVAAWQARYERMGAEWGGVDPKQRLKWAGPSMSARSSISARLMETWAHGQAIWDVAGRERDAHARLWNIVILGVNTFGFSHQVQGLEIPEEMPGLRLTLKGEERVWGAPSAGSIVGSAEAFAQVVTQVRNCADVALQISGPVAERWMETAQCFAGPRNPPPAAGTRYRS